MKKLFFLVISVFLFAQGLNWYSDYKKAFDVAKKENKIVMVDISKHDCPPCEFMKENVMSGKAVQNLLQKDFVLVDYYADTQDIPEKFRKHYFNFTPAILFYTGDGEFIKGVYGATSYDRFLNELKTVVKGK
jgi:thioredoxin-related protein